MTVIGLWYVVMVTKWYRSVWVPIREKVYAWLDDVTKVDAKMTKNKIVKYRSRS